MFKTAMLFSLVDVIVDRSQVFNRRIDENDRSVVAFVAGLTKMSLTICTTWDRALTILDDAE